MVAKRCQMSDGCLAVSQVCQHDVGPTDPAPIMLSVLGAISQGVQLYMTDSLMHLCAEVVQVVADSILQRYRRAADFIFGPKFSKDMLIENAVS